MADFNFDSKMINGDLQFYINMQIASGKTAEEVQASLTQELGIPTDAAVDIYEAVNATVKRDSYQSMSLADFDSSQLIIKKISPWRPTFSETLSTEKAAFISLTPAERWAKLRQQLVDGSKPQKAEEKAKAEAERLRRILLDELDEEEGIE